jgi:hypothetical protein
VSYIGNEPAVGQWRKLTDISSSFNGVTTTFTTSVPPGTSDYYVTAGSASQLIISLGGVIQEPDVDYTVSTNTITFTTAPASGLSFFGVLCGDALNIGAPSDGSVTTSKLGSNLTVDLTSGSATTPSLTFDANTGLYSPGADQVAISTNGTGRLFIDSSGRLLVGTSTARANIDAASSLFSPQFQIEGTSGDSSSLSIIRNSTSPAGYPRLFLAKSKGATVGSNTAVASGDDLGEIVFNGADGTNFIEAAGIKAQVDGTPGANDMPGRLVFSTTADGASSPTERMRISNKGNTTITSVADNDAALRVDSNGTPGAQYGIYIETGNDQNDATRTFIGCVGGATTRAQIRSNGGIANYSANDVNLSDLNVKKNIAPAADTWSCLKDWEIVNFHYKDQSDDADLNMGVIAQQVAESCPEVVTVFQEAKEATETEPAQEERIGVKEQQMMWMAIKALQEAQLRIETLEAEVAALKAS